MIFDFHSYQVAARETATYPQKYGVAYVTLGLIGETGEVADKIKKLIRDDAWEPGQPVPENRRDPILKELGDVLWYVANYAHEQSINLDRLFVADDPQITSLPSLAVDMAEQAQKPMRLNLVFIVKAIANIALLLDSDINKVAQMNNEKLADRARRKMLGGSGDYR